ncbi:MAG: hypothetical protein K6F49_08830 [Saccharofermentans sp.]|nr:hypothetical protein [Saccharofermentans sp.]
MYDLKVNLKSAGLLFLSLLFFGAFWLFLLAADTLPILIMVPLLLALLSLAGIILCFVPFFKDHMWLIPIADLVIGSVVAVIIHFI